MLGLFDSEGGGEPEFNPRAFLERATALAREIPSNPKRMTGGRGALVGPVLQCIRNLNDRLTDLARAIDPIRHMDIYDPSHPEAAAGLIAEKIERSPPYPLGRLEPFWGSGVYAIYYHGDHPAYAPISGRDIALYVGKADPAIPNATTARQQEDKIYRRLNEHARSIRLSESYVLSMDEIARSNDVLYPIRLQDFTCRFLVLASAYAGAVERNLIRHYAPAWNNETGVCVGLGKHGDAATTRANSRSDWDTLHPGRPWATREGNVSNRRSPREIQQDLLEHFWQRGLVAEEEHGDERW